MEIRIIKNKKQAREEIGLNNIKDCKDCFKNYKKIGKEIIFIKEETKNNNIHLNDLEELNKIFKKLEDFYIKNN